MKLPRRNFLRLAVGAAALPAASRIGWAQTYPTRPVRIIVPLAAGTRRCVAIATATLAPILSGTASPAPRSVRAHPAPIGNHAAPASVFDSRPSEQRHLSKPNRSTGTVGAHNVLGDHDQGRDRHRDSIAGVSANGSFHDRPAGGAAPTTRSITWSRPTVALTSALRDRWVGTRALCSVSFCLRRADGSMGRVANA